jgi:large subunit ribosomal protein L6
VSRVGKLPVQIPSAVKVNVSGNSVSVSGPRGSLQRCFSGPISIIVDNSSVKVLALDDTKFARSMWGTARNIIKNMVFGVSEGFEQVVEMVGVGYKAVVRGQYVNLSLAKSHSTIIKIPEGVSVISSEPTVLKVSSNDNEKLGQFVSLLIKQRPPEPYKGKGIRKKGQYVYRKEGKKGK